MKNYFYFGLVASLLLFSCNNDEDFINLSENNNPLPREVIKVPSKSFLYDGIYEIRDGKEIDLTNTQFLTKSSSSYEFYDIATIQPVYIYLGNILSAESINKGVYDQVGYSDDKKQEIRVSFTIPGVMSSVIGLSKGAFEDAVKLAIGNKNFSGQQSQVFTYKMKEFSYYSELKLAFGANVNVIGLLGVSASVESERIKKNSALFVDFSQTYFSAYMDTPNDGNIFKDESTRQKYLPENPVYINTVNYGRKGIIAVESNESYESLSVAVRAAFNAGIVDGKLAIDANTEEILKTAQINICILGGDGQQQVKTVMGFNEFQNFIIKGGVYNPSVYGVPISFGGAYASNNGMFTTQFEITMN